ncbi:hypothetical protein F441_12885 [Phytophthora nicotianae CJ01A1]|uniref:Uncharacterized protein n=1 Tax=Phytophthora nicotianae CJ01A1 TaxID=1317063 RepID=W2WM18_PHYNI|nr:hypothetical protein F441_12885 [Phytophthora nicotianae CJ01A1]
MLAVLATTVSRLLTKDPRSVEVLLNQLNENTTAEDPTDEDAVELAAKNWLFSFVPVRLEYRIDPRVDCEKCRARSVKNLEGSKDTSSKVFVDFFGCPVQL